MFWVVACQGQVSETPIPPTPLPQVIHSPTPVLPSQEPTPTLTPTPLALFDSLVSVVFIVDHQTLPVYSTPDETSNPIAQLEANHTNLSITGGFQEREGKFWAEILLPQGGSGWVDANYLTPSYPAEQFCSNPEITGLSRKVIEIFQQKDGDRLAELVSPIHGLRLRIHWSDVEVYLGKPEEVRNLFSNPQSYQFGVEKRTQEPVQGTFLEVVIPKLMDMQGELTENCNRLDQGLAADWVSGFIQWPFEYANMNYLVSYRPAPAEDELNWRMWALGIEWLNRQPFLTVMVHYKWDY